jgi:hypothetical protein
MLPALPNAIPPKHEYYVTPNQASFNEPYNLMNLNALASIMNAIPI